MLSGAWYGCGLRWLYDIAVVGWAAALTAEEVAGFVVTLVLRNQSGDALCYVSPGLRPPP